MKKVLILVLAMLLAVCLGIGATLAYLYVETKSVINTFEYGDVNIDLTETVGNELKSAAETDVKNDTFKMIPGNTLAKDPTVTVKEDSEACYLFVKVTESENFDDFMTYAIADGWTLYNTTDTGADIPTNDAADEYVIYCKVDATTADKNIQILAGNTTYKTGCVTVISDVTKDQLNDLTEDTYPTLTFTAYAVQQANLTLEQAYAQAFPSN